MKLSIEKLDRRCLMAASSGFVPYSMPVTTTNTTQIIKVLAVNFDPIIPSQGNKHLWEAIPWWFNPKKLATEYKTEMEYASGGAIKFEIVEWRDINDIPVLANGYDYTADEYYHNALNGGFHFQGVPADWDKIKSTQNFAQLINSGSVDEVWLFGEHNMELFGEAWMAGAGSFDVNGPIFNYPELNRPFVGLSFDYGRGLGEMMHNMAHRAERTMAKFYGGWDLNSPKTMWDFYSSNAHQTNNGIGGIGNCHFPVNAKSDYDYDNTSVVTSTANDWANYPNMTFSTTQISRDAWSDINSNPNYHKDYLSWWFGHLPRAVEKHIDGRQNNWWKYIYDYNNYQDNGIEKPFLAKATAVNVNSYGGKEFTFTVSYSSAYVINNNSIGSKDIVVIGPKGTYPATFVSISDRRNTNYLVATFKISAPGGFWDASDNGTYQILSAQKSVFDSAGRFVVSGSVGKFSTNIINPIAPQITSAIALNKAIRLSWTRVNDPKFAVMNYVVSISNDKLVWRQSLRVSPTINLATISGLSNGKSYYFKIGAVGRNSDGTFVTRWSNISNKIMPINVTSPFPQILVKNKN